MAIVDVLKVFHTLKRAGAVHDYILSGSVAAMVHTQPFYTEDVDIAVSVASDQEFLHLFSQLAESGRPHVSTPDRATLRQAQGERFYSDSRWARQPPLCVGRLNEKPRT